MTASQMSMNSFSFVSTSAVCSIGSQSASSMSKQMALVSSIPTAGLTVLGSEADPWQCDRAGHRLMVAEGLV